MAIVERTGIDKRWNEYAAEEWSDAVVAVDEAGGHRPPLLRVGHRDRLLPGGHGQSAGAGRPSPRLITMMHEQTALNAALGVAMVTGQPAATAVHVDVGTINYGGAHAHGVARRLSRAHDRGHRPRAYPGSMPGARNNAIQWYQEPRDQGEILRQYTKMDHRMESQDNPGLMISRLLQVAMSEPKGPVYLALPREAAMTPIPRAAIRFPTARPARHRAAVVARSRTMPKMSPAGSSRRTTRASTPRTPAATPSSVDELVRLAELLAVPVNAGPPDPRADVPHRRIRCSARGPRPKDADALLIIEKPGAVDSAARRALARRADRLGRRRPGAVALQDDGVAGGPLAGLPRRKSRGARDLRGGHGHAEPERHEPHRRPARAAGAPQARDGRPG